MPRIAVVTGGNRGIGLEICRQLGRLGLEVVLTARDEVKGHAAAKQLDAEGLDVSFQQLDVTDPASVQQFTKDMLRYFKGIDVLVNNAAILPDEKQPALAVDLDVVRNTLETNVLGVWRLCQSIVPIMLKQHYGRVVNLSSGYGQLSEMDAANAPAYRLSKTAVNALTRLVAAECAGTNVLVNAVCPGWVRTDMGGPGAERPVEKGAETPVWLATLPDGGPTGALFRDRQPIAW